MKHTDKSNGSDSRIVKVIRVYADGKVRAARTPPQGWGTRGRAHAIPMESEGPSEVAPPRVKNPAKVAAGKARAAKAAAAKLAASKPSSSPINAAQVKAKASKPKTKAKPAKKAAAKAPAKRGGARANSGPKPKGDKAMVVVAFRVTPAQKKKLAKLGNGDFIRDRIDRASDPK